VVNALVGKMAHWLIAGFVLMALSVACGLLHRYAAIDYMRALVQRRRRARNSVPSATRTADNARPDAAHSDEKAKDWRLVVSDWTILLAPLFLLLGACCLFAATLAAFNVGGPAPQS
jgi:hypothetical protein